MNGFVDPLTNKMAKYNVQVYSIKRFKNTTNSLTLYKFELIHKHANSQLLLLDGTEQKIHLHGLLILFLIFSVKQFELEAA